MNLDSRLLRLLRGGLVPFTWAILGGLGAGVLAILQAKGLSQVIARVFLGGQSLPDVMPVMWTLLGVILGRAALGMVGDWAGISLAFRVKSQLRDLLVEKIFKLGPLYARAKPAGELTGIALQGVDDLEAYFSQYLPQIILAGLIPAAVLALVFPVDWPSGLILLVTGPLIPFFMFLIGSSAGRLTRRQFGALSRMSAYLLDTLQGLRALKELGRGRDQEGRIRAVSERYRDTTLQVLRVTFLSALALELLGTISTALIAVQIGLRLLYGQMGFEQAFFILLISPDFYLPLRTLGLRFHASMRGVSAARKVFSVLDEPEAVEFGQPGREAIPPKPASGVPAIQFERVTYQYADRGEPAVSDLTFDVWPGSLTALVGESGAGKSTVLSLLQGFIQPQSGEIRLNGVRLEDVSPEDRRRVSAWVGQRPYFTSGSVAYNLRIANNDASEDDLRRACRLAQLDTWLNAQPEGLHTPLGEGASRLSGGQAQRLALARAFLRDAALIFMDEPTAHLDPLEETVLDDVVRRLCAGRTAILIAHRLTTIAKADQILVFSGGRIVEAGRHADLVAKQGAYAALVAAAGGER